MPHPTTICFIATNHGVAWGASEHLWCNAAGHLSSRPDVHVVASVAERAASMPAIAALEASGATVLVRPWEDDERAFEHAAVPAQAAVEVASRRPDLVVVSHGDNREGFPWMEHCAELRLPFVSVAHRASEWDWPHSVIVGRLRNAYLAAVETHFVSEHNLRLTELMICAPLPAATVVRNPFAVDYGSAIPWPRSSDVLRLACVARFDLESKAHDVLFEVMAMPKWRERPIEIDLVGREGPHQDLLVDLRNLLKLDNVRLSTTVDDIRTVWRECHALVLPSRREGLPIAIVEAMLAGRPCVGTDIGGTAEVIEHGRTGWVAESPTVLALDRALDLAWAARGDWASIGTLGAQRIRSLVPEDPAAVYADRLAGLVASVRAR